MTTKPSLSFEISRCDLIYASAKRRDRGQCAFRGQGVVGVGRRNVILARDAKPGTCKAASQLSAYSTQNSLARCSKKNGKQVTREARNFAEKKKDSLRQHEKMGVLVHTRDRVLDRATNWTNQPPSWQLSRARHPRNPLRRQIIDERRKSKAADRACTAPSLVVSRAICQRRKRAGISRELWALPGVGACGGEILHGRERTRSAQGPGGSDARDQGMLVAALDIGRLLGHNAS